jgi:hypothetical protein
MGFGKIRVKRERLVVAMQRLIVKVEGDARIAEIGQGQGVVGPQGEGLSIAGASLLVTP